MHIHTQLVPLQLKRPQKQQEQRHSTRCRVAAGRQSGRKTTGIAAQSQCQAIRRRDLHGQMLHRHQHAHAHAHAAHGHKDQQCLHLWGTLPTYLTRLCCHFRGRWLVAPEYTWTRRCDVQIVVSCRVGRLVKRGQVKSNHTVDERTQERKLNKQKTAENRQERKAYWKENTHTHTHTVRTKGHDLWKQKCS